MNLKLRIANGKATAMGPGKADLLEAIEACGSISAAAKQMKMSYRRAWELVDVMNKSFTQPLVTTSPGGHHGGGAQVTEFGLLILKSYRNLIIKANNAAQLEIAQITSHLKMPD
jgi:molybdate transport system regulatory protein